MESKSKFNKKKCLKCKYHGTGCGHSVKTQAGVLKVHCNYSIVDKTCLQKLDDGTIIDRRGDDYDNCKLYEKGKVISGGKFKYGGVL